MNTSAPPDTLTVLYDGACPLCRREISHVKGLADRRGDNALCFVDVSNEAGKTRSAVEREALLARFHVERSDGSRLDGAAAFVAMWERLPGWRWLARFAQLPGMLTVFEFAYRGFLHLRPYMQGAVRHWEAARGDDARAPELSLHLERELRSDHAGETGAVWIYRGITTVASWRKDEALLAFARRHRSTEEEHLRLVEAWLPAARRSFLLGPWRLAGWLTGALPALFGSRAVYGTIAAVETFVDTHYQQQIEHLERHGGPDGLLPMLLRCQADERHHRDESAALAGPNSSLLLRAWCALVGAGSAAAVVVARRI